MKLATLQKSLRSVHRGAILNVKLKSDLTRYLNAASRNAGIKLFHESTVQVQSRIPYKNIREVKRAIEESRRDAPSLPRAASGVYSVENGIILYTPQNNNKSLLAGIRPIKTLRSRFVDGNGVEISESLAQHLLVPSYFKRMKSKEEHKESGTGEWRTVYLDTIQTVGETV